MLNRTLESIVFSPSFGRQMRFLVGPRQTGKTTLAKAFLHTQDSSNLYYNWDNPEVRKAYRQNPSFFMPDVLKNKKTKSWICFDEIHKIPRWKNHLKGIFDQYEDKLWFIITGSARLDLLKYTGESLLGRYFTFHLYPLTLAEVTGSIKILTAPSPLAKQWIEKILSHNPKYPDAFEQLLEHGGFPEPFLAQSKDYLKKWHQDYFYHYVREDIRDFTNIREVENVFHLAELLPARIGNPLSLNSLKEDIEVSHTAIRNYIRALELTYVLYLLKPYSQKIIKSIKKEPKAYFFDWTRAMTKAQVFENYVCMELMTYCALLSDSGKGDYALWYIRTKDGKETDFLITADKKPWALFECKLTETDMASHHKLHSKYLGNIPVVQLVKKPSVFSVFDNHFFVVSANRFFEALYC